MILDDFRLTDQVAIVTGGGAGIGRGTAVALAETGADVVVAGRTKSDLEKTVRQIEHTGRRGLAVVADVMVEDDLAKLHGTALQCHRAVRAQSRRRAGAPGARQRNRCRSDATQAMDFVMGNEALRNQFEQNTPMWQIGTPPDIAAAVVYLVSPAPSWVTGMFLRVDGDTTAPAFAIPVPPLQPRANPVA